MRRRILFILLALVGVAVLALATLPFWLDAAVRPFAQTRGLTFATYERVGYGRFALTGVEFRRENVRVAVSRVEAPTPLVWGWRHWRDGSNPIAAERWEVEVTKNPNPKPAPPDRGWMSLRGQLDRIATQLDRWLPQATVGPGVVRFPGGEIAVSSATWRERTLEAKALKFREYVADATLALGRGEEPWQLRAMSPQGPTQLAITSRGPALEGAITWRGQRATLSGRFEPRGWQPSEAALNAERWTLPGDALKLGQLYSSVQGSARIEWREQRFLADVNATGEPLPGKSVPPLKIVARGQGDPRAFTVEALEVDIPGVVARLSESVTVDRQGKLAGGGARFEVDADLAKQPWLTATGRASGQARIVSGEGTVPVVEFTLGGRDVSAKDLSLARVDARGRLAWPKLEVESATVVGGAGEQLALRGGWDFKAKEILAATVEGEIRRQSIARWLPKQPEFDRVVVAAQASGPVATMRHEGRATAKDVVFAGVNPLALSLRWNGAGLGAEHFVVEATAQASRIIAQGSANREELRLTAFDFEQNAEPRLKLDGPATLRWKPVLEVEAFHLSGPQGNLRLSGRAGPRGNVELAAANVSSRWFADFVAAKGPTWQLTLFALMGKWDRGPMTFSLTAGAAVEIAPGRMAAVNAAARGDGEGLRIDAVRATEGDATVVNATGRLPVTLHPGGAPLLRIEQTAPIAIDATAAPNAAFWQKLGDVVGVELHEPEATANVGGTWDRPEGSVNVKVAKLALDPKKTARPMPAIEQVDVRLAADRGGLRFDTFTFQIAGQPIRVQGRLPVPDGQWRSLFKEPLALAQQGADLQVEVPEAEIAMFARYLPAVLAPKGRLSAQVTFRRGALGGFVRLKEAASRPLGPLGVLQEVSAELELADRALLLRQVQARSGGQPVTLTGRVELPEKAAPRFDLVLKGENLPFVRQTGLLMRGDLDLKLQTPNEGPTRLTGTVRLRDSLFLSDLRAFVPQGGASAARRPPYFSVDTPPVNTWVLAVEVVGERFMRLRTAIFNGVASARFRLSGTLGEPRAIGEVEIDEGLVRMPFARFEVQQGSVRLTEADPYEPTIYLRGTGRRYGYDLTVEIDGKASAPNVVFTSSPALESEQVLLMVMTGAAPANEISVTGTQRMTRLGTFVGQNLLSSFTADGAEADRLSIASGEKISRQGKETYDIEYKLSEKWTLTGEYNEFDEYNAGLKWRIFRGERKPPAPKPGAKEASQPGEK